MLNRMRSIYSAVTNTLAAAWMPLTIGLGTVVLLFGAGGRA